MKIGAQDVPSGQQAYGSRRQIAEPRVMPEADMSGLGSLANALGNVGQLGGAYLAIRTKEEEERQNYDAMLKYNQFEGAVRRNVAGATTGLPADGSGYAGLAATTWQKGYDEFQKSIPSWLQERYAPQAEDFKNSLVLSADEFTRSATRGHSITTIDKAIEDGRLEVYRDPSKKAEVEARIAGMVGAAPGLRPDERAVKADGGLSALNGAAFGGMLRTGRENMYAVPYSPDVTQRLVPAVMRQESDGNPNAVSSKGAQGLMQVMPATGYYIAQKIHDRNFPEDAADWPAYLRRPDVSVKYGTFYLNEQLQRYGGDVELALVAYNAGPGMADKYQAAGRNRAVLPDETKNYVDKITASIGGITPDMAFDPQYGLGLDQALAADSQIQQIMGQAERDAQQTITTRLELATQAQEVALQRLNARAEGGEEFRPMYLEAVENGQVAYNQNDLNAGQAISNRVLETQYKTQEAYRKASTGEPLSAAEGNLMMPPALVQGIAQGNKEAIDTSIARAQAINFIPEAMQTQMTRMLFSQNLDEVGTAAEIYAELNRTNPALTMNLPDEFVQRASGYNWLRATRLPSDQIQEIMDVSSTVEGRKSLEAIKKADKSYADMEALLPADITNTFDSWLPLSGDIRPPSGRAGALLQQQYQALFDGYYATTLNAEGAKDLALKKIGETWGATSTGGQQQMMWLPPEIALSNFQYDVDGDGETEAVRLTPTQASITMDRTVRREFGIDRYILTPFPETELAIAQGKPIPYLVIPVDEDGEVDYHDFVSNPGKMKAITQPVFYDYGKILIENQNFEGRRGALLEEQSLLDPSMPDFAEKMDRVTRRLEEIERELAR
jgi:hypothetical protein